MGFGVTLVVFRQSRATFVALSVVVLVASVVTFVIPDLGSQAVSGLFLGFVLATMVGLFTNRRTVSHT